MGKQPLSRLRHPDLPKTWARHGAALEQKWRQECKRVQVVDQQTVYCFERSGPRKPYIKDLEWEGTFICRPASNVLIFDRIGFPHDRLGTTTRQTERSGMPRSSSFLEKRRPQSAGLDGPACTNQDGRWDPGGGLDAGP